MKVVLFTDSLGMPRPPGMGNIPYEATYPFRLEHALRARFADLVFTHRGMRYRTVLDVLAEWQEQVEFKRPDAVIVQVGCNDAAPRLLLPREREWIRKLPFPRFRTKLLRLEDRYRHVALRHWERVCVPEDRFRRALAELVRRADEDGVKQLFLVNMHDCTDKIEARLPGAFVNRDRYNAILNGLRQVPSVRIIDMHAVVAKHGGAGRLTIDGLHLNAEGNRHFAEAIERAVVAAFPPRRAPPRVREREGVRR